MNISELIHKKNILVIGDVMLDTYFYGSVNRISPEAPVPVFLKKSEKSVLGGAANVATNLVAAQQNVSILSIVGCDNNGKKLKDLLAEQGIDVSLILETESRQTTEKTRFLASNYQQLLRLDVDDTEYITIEEESILYNKLKDRILSFDLIIISDYLKGLLTYTFTQKIIKLANQFEIKVIIDVKDSNFQKYAGAYLLKPYLKEIRYLTNLSAQTDQEIVAAS